MRIAVLGAAGHIGTALTLEFARMHQVTAFVRKRVPHPALDQIELDWQEGDLANAEFRRIARDFDCIVDAAAFYPLAYGTPIQEVRRAEERISRTVDAVVAENTRYAYISSFVTLPRQESPVRRLSSRAFSKTHPYYVAKAQMERIVLGAARSSADTRVFNPSACLGPWDRRRLEHCIIPQLLLGNIPVAAEQRINVIDVRDLAAFIASRIETGAEGRPVPVFGHDIAVSAFVDEVCRQGRVDPPRTIGIPGALTSLAMAGAEVGATLLQRELPTPALPVLLMNESYELVEPAPAVTCRSLTETITDSISWYESIGYLASG